MILFVALRAAGRRLDPASGVPVVTVVRAPFARRVKAEGNLKATKATPLVAPGTDISLKIAWLAADGIRTSSRGRARALRSERSPRRRCATARPTDGTTSRSSEGDDQVGAAIADRESDAVLAGDELDQTRKFQSKDARSSRATRSSSRRSTSSSRARSRTRGTKAKQARRSGRDSNSAVITVERQKADLAIHHAPTALTEHADRRAARRHLSCCTATGAASSAELGDSLWPATGGRARSRCSTRWRPRCSCSRSTAAGSPRAGRATVVIEARPDTDLPGEIRLVDKLAKPRTRARRCSTSPSWSRSTATDPRRDEARPARARVARARRRRTRSSCRARRSSTRTARTSSTVARGGLRARRGRARPGDRSARRRRAGARRGRRDRPARPDARRGGDGSAPLAAAGGGGPAATPARRVRAAPSSSLGEHKLRSALTMLGMMFGVGAVIAMLSIGAGAERQALALIERLGTRNVVVRGKDVQARRARGDPQEVASASRRATSRRSRRPCRASLVRGAAGRDRRRTRSSPRGARRGAGLRRFATATARSRISRSPRAVSSMPLDEKRHGRSASSARASRRDLFGAGARSART